MPETDRIHAIEEGVRKLEKIHEPGGFCDRCKADFWKHINALEVVQARNALLTGMLAGAIGGLPGAVLMAIEIYRVFTHK